MPPLLLDWKRISCYEKRIDACGDGPAWCAQCEGLLLSRGRPRRQMQAASNPLHRVKSLKWHAAGRVSLWSNNKRKCWSSGKPFAHRSRRKSSNATGNARACFFRGNASLNNCRQPATLVTARSWSRRLRSWIINSPLLNRLQTRRHQREWLRAHTSHNENHGPVPCPMTYNCGVDESLRLRFIEEERSGSAG